jgi:hypothetical protein
MNKPPGFDLIERARALKPLIAREERTRRLTAPVVAGLVENRLYHALLSKSEGIAEHSSDQFSRLPLVRLSQRTPPLGAKLLDFGIRRVRGAVAFERRIVDADLRL